MDLLLLGRGWMTKVSSSPLQTYAPHHRHLTFDICDVLRVSNLRPSSHEVEILPQRLKSDCAMQSRRFLSVSGVALEFSRRGARFARQGNTISPTGGRRV
ncbi:hypothetical protein AVEN_209381-1 [Araneus ventricosus]|uniref:Uncharacterized protein n=1 Tax=Araneus ventricosus TaxID=182803 RepID=A0A4Y2QB81_ARAVE|nr:hypothetical protein AVEN_236490-1 [Araneus ventricosus]GBN59546.1 hypothetical protein AVEN_209381-1 [Araneus ventricosus]